MVMSSRLSWFGHGHTKVLPNSTLSVLPLYRQHINWAIATPYRSGFFFVCVENKRDPEFAEGVLF